MGTQQNEEIDLGFAEKCDKKFQLTSLAFPSKLGGKPAWLRWDTLLNESQVQCENCCKIMQFLCQIYIPTELDTKQYHRTVYLFVCPSGKCHSTKEKSMKTFCSMLEENEEEELTQDDLDSKTDEELQTLLNAKESHQPMCNVCSLYADKKCSECRSVCYCSKEHQVYDWKTNKHKMYCKGEIKGGQNKFLFDEYEIVIEEEPSKENANQVKEEIDIDDEKLKELLKDEQPLDKKLEKEFENATKSTVDDFFDRFKRRIQREPNQIIRYSPGGTPLWVSSENIPSEERDIPNCSCGSKRQFEFQVLPQMLNYLGIETTVDSIDWGTICIYTCKQHCHLQPYREDFVWKQDFSQTNI